MDFLKGTVYSKALAIFLAAVLGLLGSVVALSQIVILRELAKSEQREMRSMLQRFSYLIARENVPLESAAKEWGRLFSELPPSDSPVLGLEILRGAKADFAAAFDAEGKLIGVVTDSSGDVLLKKEPDFFNNLGAQLAKGKETKYLVLGGELCLIATAEYSGQGRQGIVVAGKIFGGDSWGFFEGMFSAGVRFQVFEASDFNDKGGRHFIELLATGNGVVNSDREDQIVGYILITGFDKVPLGYVSISQPRPLRQEGLRAIQIFLTGICLAGGALVLVLWLVLDRTILARIKELSRRLNNEKRFGRLPVKLNFPGDDELANLANSIEDLALRLQSTQNLYRSILEDQTELICRFDADFRLTFANAIFYRIFEIADSDAELFLGEVVTKEAWEELRSHFLKLSADRPLVGFTHELRFGSRVSPQWFRSTLRRYFAADGAPAGGQWVLADITAQVSAQRKMVDSERRFRRLFETASDGLLLIEGETLAISDINPSLCRMLLVAGSEVLGRKLDEYHLFAPCIEAVAEFRRRGRERGAFRSECRLARGDETSLFVELRCGEYDVDGVGYLQLSFRNISERVLGERELRRLSAKLLRLQDEERRRIARELHDSTAQNLSALEMNMSLLEPLVEGAGSVAARIVADTRQIAAECSKELRNISYLLHPPLIDEVGLVFAVRWFADGFSKRTGISTTVELDEGFPRLSADLEMPLFRVVQEALTNIYRHSGAAGAWVRLWVEGEWLNLEIRDNGRGFLDGTLGEGTAERSTGVGLSGMKERIANIGGTLDIESSPLGATLTIRLRLGREEVWRKGAAELEPS